MRIIALSYIECQERLDSYRFDREVFAQYNQMKIVFNNEVFRVRITELEQKLRDRGVKLTQPRRAVLKVLGLSDSHLTPAEVYRRGRRHYRKLGLVTVYRTLTLLEELGLAQRVHMETGCHSFAAVRSSESHHHQLICKDCGRVEEFSDCASEKLLARLQQETGFAIEDHRLEVIGHCPNCR